MKFCTGQRSAAGTREPGDNRAGSIRGGEYFDELREGLLLKMGYSPWSLLSVLVT